MEFLFSIFGKSSVDSSFGGSLDDWVVGNSGDTMANFRNNASEAKFFEFLSGKSSFDSGRDSSFGDWGVSNGF